QGCGCLYQRLAAGDCLRFVAWFALVRYIIKNRWQDGVLRGRYGWRAVGFQGGHTTRGGVLEIHSAYWAAFQTSQFGLGVNSRFRQGKDNAACGDGVA